MSSAQAQHQQRSFNLGSVWRKWDLHVHAPSSVFNNGFAHRDGEPDWNTYFGQLDASGASVLGITDYFSIEGYKRVSVAHKAGLLPRVDMVLPNVEFRLNLMIPTHVHEDQAQVRKVNAHVLFSPEVSPVDIEEHFLSQLHFTASSSPQGNGELWALTVNQLTQFGARLKEQHSAFQDSAYSTGCMNAAVDFNELKRVLTDRASVFERKYLILMATENTSLISWDGQGHAIRKTLLQGSHGVFGSHGDRNFYLGRRHPSVEAFIEEFGSLKPCLQGSDAHRPDRIGEAVNGRFCWIKANPTFEGLRQVAFEPEDRIVLDEKPPLLKHPYRVISSVAVRGAPDWFSFSALDLNPDLVTIIGGKGAGKSALSELIAFAGGSEVFRKVKPRDLQDTFLAKASKRSPSNLRTISGATVQLTWADGNVSTATIGDSLDHEQSEELVKYLPQKFVEQMCSAENHGELVKELERVIFHRIPIVDRLGTSTFADLRDLKTKRVQVTKQTLIEQLNELNREVFASFERLNTRPEKERALALQEKELIELKKLRPDTAAASQADLSTISALQELQKRLQADNAEQQGFLSQLEEIEARFSNMALRVEAFNSEIALALGKVGITDEEESLRIRMPEAVTEVIKTRRSVIQSTILRLKNGPGDNLADSGAQLTNASARLALTQARKTEFEKYEKDRQALESSISALTNEIALLNTTLSDELRVKRQRRFDKYLDLFDVLKEEKAALDVLYEPLQSALASGGETDRKLDFNSRIAFNVEEHATTGCELFDNRRKGRFKDRDLLVVELRKFVAEVDAGGYDRDFTTGKLRALREGFLVDENGAAITIREQLKKSKTEEDFNNWFFSLDPYSVEYGITFESRNLSLLSPGQKGIVLLLVYLEVDQDDQRPLIIDQPEDNLDNLSVYSNLIQFFRKRKLSRQLILITHNPNLVVNTDAEQIIVASYEGERNPRIMYQSGALEESCMSPPGVREQVCAILEGGSEAFLRREEKYSFT